MQMFSPEIQQVLGACAQQGKVNLAAGADTDGSVVCGDRSRTSPVQFNEYVNTLSDILAAGGLIGFRTALLSDPRVTPQMISTALNTGQGSALLRRLLEQGFSGLNLVYQGSTESVSFLTDRVMQRFIPLLKTPNSLQNLLGTPSQYSQVVENFCNPPGMSIRQARALVPGLSSVQMYAICVQESGLTDEMRSPKRRNP